VHILALLAASVLVLRMQVRARGSGAVVQMRARGRRSLRTHPTVPDGRRAAG
jgi:hypothetical protein